MPEILHEFAVHMLNDEGKNKAQDIAEKFSELLNYCREVSIPGREISIVATKLEEACFFAKKAMATKLSNQQGS